MSETPQGNDAAAPPCRRHALVVGVNTSSYSGLGALSCAERDAEEMCGALGGAACGFSASALLGDKATSAAVQSAIIRLIREHQHPEDFLLFYFSGHGRYIEEDVYLVTSNFDPVEVEFNRDVHLSLRLLRQLLYERTQAGRVLLILDCCYSGDIAGSGLDANLEDLFAQIRRYLGDNATAPSKTTATPRDAQRWTLTAALSNEQRKKLTAIACSPTIYCVPCVGRRRLRCMAARCN